MVLCRLNLTGFLWVVAVGVVVVLGAKERTSNSGISFSHATSRGRGRIVGQRQMLYDHYGRRLRITPKECQSSSPRYQDLDGICMFNLECQESSGTVIGACVDRFLFGACCHISDPVKRKAILAANSTTSGTITTSALLSPEPRPLPTDPQPDKPQPHHVTKFGGQPTIRIPHPHPINFPSPPPPSYENHSTRFPSRGTGSSEPGGGISQTPPNPRDPSSVPFGKYSALPPPPNSPPLLPLTLETFSSFRHPAPYSSYGSGHPLRNENGQSPESVEHETLGLGFVVTRDKHKPRPSSTKISVSSSSSSSSSNRDSSSSSTSTSTSTSTTFKGYTRTTPEPPSKFSTFMYLDNDDSKMTSTQKSVRSSTEQQNVVEVEDKSPGDDDQDLDSNTENVWSVMMQLGSQDKLLNLAGSTVPKRTSTSSLDPAESVTSMMAELITSSAPDFKSESEQKADQTEESGDASTKYPPLKFFGDVAVAPPSPSEGGESTDEESGTTEKEETTKPWASSTYYVHTFKYPNFTGGEDMSNSEEQFEFVPSTTSSTTTTATATPKEQSSTQPSIGKITTWSGLGTVVDKEQLSDRHGIFEEKSTTPIPETTTTTTTTKPTTTKPPTTTTKKHYTTRSTSTENPTTARTTAATTKKPVPTEKWRKPAPYTLPPHKRPTTTEKEDTSSSSEEDGTKHKDSQDPTEEEEMKVESKEEPTTSTTTTKKPPTKQWEKAPVKKNSEKETRQPMISSLSSSIILDEDMDTNLDDFVEQVVQGLAGSLDNLNIDNVILSANHDDHHSSHSPDPTIDPLQVISDPSFPPFPIMGETLLTKPNVKNNAQEKVGPTLATTTTEATTISTTTTTQKPLDWRKDCGVRTQPKSGRIVGGTASKFGRWPWQALVKEATWLGLFSKNKCGGVLIAPKYVLTAAHCQPGFLATLTVVLGEFDISSHSEGGANSITKNVRRVIVHRDYNAQTFENDIALLELDSAVDFKSHIVPICMPNDEEEFLGKKAFVTGWGRLKYGGGVPQILHEVDVPILKNDECQDMFHKSNHLKAIRDSFICAGYAEGFKDSCEGDSGGPLSIQRPNGQWVLAGTVSHGIKCAYPNLPGVYMRMTFYKPWIKRVTGIK